MSKKKIYILFILLGCSNLWVYFLWIWIVGIEPGIVQLTVLQIVANVTGVYWIPRMNVK